MADGEGLEPPDVSRRQRFSKPQHLAILPPILKKSHITSGECRVRNFPLPNNRLYLPISRHSQKQQSSLSTTAQRSSRLCIPGSPGFFGWYMACRSNRSIPAHSIPVTPTPRGLSSSLYNKFSAALVSLVRDCCCASLVLKIYLPNSKQNVKKVFSI